MYDKEKAEIIECHVSEILNLVQLKSITVSFSCAISKKYWKASWDFWSVATRNRLQEAECLHNFSTASDARIEDLLHNVKHNIMSTLDLTMSLVRPYDLKDVPKAAFTAFSGSCAFKQSRLDFAGTSNVPEADVQCFSTCAMKICIISRCYNFRVIQGTSVTLDKFSHYLSNEI